MYRIKRGIFILFSGGYDSSYLVSKVLNKFENIGYDSVTNNTEINLVSIEANFSGSKTDREKETRKKLIDYWKRKYSIKINCSTIKIDVSDLKVKTTIGLLQPLFWLPSLLTSLDLVNYDCIDILFSYILGDQSLSVKENIDNIINNTLNIAVMDTVDAYFTEYNCKDIKAKVNTAYPLSHISKEDLLLDLIRLDQYVFENCTTCENSGPIDFCGFCKPCFTLKQSLNNILSYGAISAEERSIINKKLSQFDKSEQKKEEAKEDGVES